jgi:prophage endopeptidase
VSALDRLLWGALALVLAGLGVRWYGAHEFAAGVLAEQEAQRGRALVATVARVQDNAVEAAKQQSINLTVTEKKHEELAPVIRTVYVDRVRVGAASCGPAAPTDTQGPSGGNGADSASRLVRADVERDTRALGVAVEEALATGRACQAFVVANGLGEYQTPSSASSEHSFNAATSAGENSTSEK